MQRCKPWHHGKEIDCYVSVERIEGPNRIRPGPRVHLLHKISQDFFG